MLTAFWTTVSAAIWLQAGSGVLEKVSVAAPPAADLSALMQVRGAYVTCVHTKLLNLPEKGSDSAALTHRLQIECAPEAAAYRDAVPRLFSSLDRRADMAASVEADIDRIAPVAVEAIEDLERARTKFRTCVTAAEIDLDRRNQDIDGLIDQIDARCSRVKTVIEETPSIIPPETARKAADMLMTEERSQIRAMIVAARNNTFGERR